MDLKLWNKNLKHLRENILFEDKIEENKNLCLSLHARVHSSLVSGIEEKTLEDELWEDLDDYTFRTSISDKGRTIAYCLWHTTRIEDITMNLLVAGEEQIFNIGSWKEKVNSNIVDTGNSMTKEEIIEFSKDINMQELKNYRVMVGVKTRKILKNLESCDMKRKFNSEKLQRILDEGAVLNVEESKWLIDYWGRKNVSGILLMPVTRHHVVHLNEAIRAKKK